MAPRRIHPYMVGMIRLFALLAFLFAVPALAAPKAELWKRWAISDESSDRQVDHTPWNQFLVSYVAKGGDGINLVRYAAVSAADRTALDRYVAALSAVPVTALRRVEQRAFWINLYNAVTVREVLSHYPVDSIRDIRSGLFSPGPWGKELVAVEGIALTLDDIEHRILRPGWRDPRLHYALNCAAIGCPNLQREAFTAGNTEALLERAARDFINHPRGVSAEGYVATVSSIYDWFQEDFGGNEAGVIDHLSVYASPPLAATLTTVTDLRYDYDWSLNDAAP